MNDEDNGNNFVVLGTHLYLCAWNTDVRVSTELCRSARTAVRTLNSSEVMYRRSVASNFMTMCSSWNGVRQSLMFELVFRSDSVLSPICQLDR